MSAILVTMFLKGWEGPVLPSHLWFFFKVCFFWFIMLWIWATLPRLRIDQIMEFAWKILFPLSVLNLFVTALELLIWKDPTVSELWMMAGINWTIAIVCLVVISRAGRSRISTRPMLFARSEISYNQSGEVN